MKRALLLSGLAVSVSMALSSCGVKKTAAPELGDLSYSAYSSCYASINQRQTPPSSGVVDSGYFGKLIDRRDFEEILVSDISTTASHASRENLALYVVSQTLNPSCSTFSFLSFPPSNIYKYWEEATGDLGANSLLGLYKEDCGDRCQPNQVINPVVLLNACTDRWTMVHEIAHHNFNVQRKRFKPFDSDEAVIALLMHELSFLNDTVNDYNSSPSDYKGMQLVHALDRVRDLLIRFTYQTSFEEVSIESMLMREFAISRLLNVPANAARNALSYVRYSTAAGIDRLSQIKSAAKDLKRAADQQGWSRVSRNADTLTAKINSFEDDSICYQNEAIAIYEQAALAGVFPREALLSANVSRHLEQQVHVHSEARSIKGLEKDLKKILGKLRP
jgi:hypothetical protein